MTYISDDALRDFERWDAEQAAELDRLPTCEICNEAIQDDFIYEINDCIICENCLEKHFRKQTTDYME
jgi:formylmethanofuran dehydrogenase subunit E